MESRCSVHTELDLALEAEAGRVEAVASALGVRERVRSASGSTLLSSSSSLGSSSYFMLPDRPGGGGGQGSAQSTRFNNCVLLCGCSLYTAENQRHSVALNMYYSVSLSLL